MATGSLRIAPPVAERPGLLGWARRNLFPTPFDAALTLLILLFLLWVTVASIALTLRAGRAGARANAKASAPEATRPEPAR